MALLFADGFDLLTNASSTGIVGANSVWMDFIAQGQYASGSVGTNYARFSGGAGVYLTSSGVGGSPWYSLLRKDLGINRSTIFLGMSINNPSVGALSRIAAFYDVTTLGYQLEVWVDALGHLAVGRNSTVLATSTQQLQTSNRWYRIELKAVIDSAAGAYELRVDGVTWLIASGINTRGAGSNNVGRVYCGFYSPSTGGGCIYDDFIVWDDQGDSPTGFIGDCRIQTKVPTANGSINQFTPSAGSNWQCVDDIPPNTTDYNTDATLGDEDRYVHAGNVVGSNVVGVFVQFRACKDDANARSLRAEMKSGAMVVDNGSDFTMSSSYITNEAFFNKDPNGNVSWTIAAVNGAEFGVKVTA